LRYRNGNLGNTIVGMDVTDRHRQFLATRLFPSLDGLRGLSIIPVVWHHAVGHQPGLLGRGHLGVQLFFSISGFLITTLLLREQAKTGAISLRNFYVRRTLRIFPAYYTTLFVYVALVAAVERGTQAGQDFWRHLPFYFTYTSNWFVDLASGPRVIFYFAWSLATEEQFYLCWPWVVRFSRRWHLPVLFMIALLLLGEWANWQVAPGTMMGQALWRRVMGSIASPICLGCLLAYATHLPTGFRAVDALAGRWWSAPLATVLLFVVVAVEALPSILTSLAMTFLVSCTTIRPDHSMQMVFDNKALRYVGTISYGIYLFHMLAINIVRRLPVAPGHPALVFLMSLPLSIGIATISFRYFEQPFLLLKRRFEVRTNVAGASLTTS